MRRFWGAGLLEAYEFRAKGRPSTQNPGLLGPFQSSYLLGLVSFLVRMLLRAPPKTVQYWRMQVRCRVHSLGVVPDVLNPIDPIQSRKALVQVKPEDPFLNAKLSSGFRFRA